MQSGAFWATCIPRAFYLGHPRPPGISLFCTLENIDAAGALGPAPLIRAEAAGSPPDQSRCIVLAWLIKKKMVFSMADWTQSQWQLWGEGAHWSSHNPPTPQLAHRRRCRIKGGVQQALTHNALQSFDSFLLQGCWIYEPLVCRPESSWCIMFHVICNYMCSHWYGAGCMSAVIRGR